MDDSPDRQREAATVRDRRDREADARDDAADRREQADDVREGVLDRWERELTERATALDLLHEDDRAARELEREQRARARTGRRADAEHRREAAIGRAIDRTGRSDADAEGSPLGLDVRTERALEQLAVLVRTGGQLSKTLQAMSAIAIDALPQAAAITVSLPIDGLLEPAVSTAAWAHDIDAVQCRRRQGPIFDAIETQRVVVTTDLSTDERWQLGSAVGSTGRRGALSVAIVVGDQSSGALTAYAEAGTHFDQRSVLTAGMLAAQAALAIGWTMERLAHHARSEAWERALASRDQIGQAKGILMEQHNVTAAAAFELMRITSQRHNSKVRDIAEHVVTHRRLPDAPGDSAPTIQGAQQ